MSVAFEEISDSIKARLYERISSPLWGAFILSWATINWRFWTVLFLGDSDIPVRMEYILKNIPRDSTYMFWYPALSTALIILIVPFVGLGAYWVTQNYRKHLILIRTNFEFETPLTRYQSKKLLVELANEFKELQRKGKLKAFRLTIDGIATGRPAVAINGLTDAFALGLVEKSENGTFRLTNKGQQYATWLAHGDSKEDEEPATIVAESE